MRTEPRLQTEGISKSRSKEVYHGEVVSTLEQIWEVLGRICSGRLKPFLLEI